jgi:hypothetical protein
VRIFEMGASMEAVYGPSFLDVTQQRDHFRAQKH